MKSLLLCLTIFFLLIFASCKKNKCDVNSPGDCEACYERLAGTWTLNYLATNGIDSVAYFDSLFDDNCFFYIEFYNMDIDFSFGPSFSINWGDIAASYFDGGGQYTKITKDSYLQVELNQYPLTNTVNPFKNWSNYHLPQLWKINKLSDTELWFQFENGNLYEMRLNK